MRRQYVYVVARNDLPHAVFRTAQQADDYIYMQPHYNWAEQHKRVSWGATKLELLPALLDKKPADRNPRDYDNNGNLKAGIDH